MRDMPAKKFGTLVRGMGFTASGRDALFIDARGNEVAAVIDRYADGSWHVNRRETLKRLAEAHRLTVQNEEAAGASTPAASGG